MIFIHESVYSREKLRELDESFWAVVYELYGLVRSVNALRVKYFEFATLSANDSSDIVE